MKNKLKPCPFCKGKAIVKYKGQNGTYYTSNIFLQKRTRLYRMYTLLCKNSTVQSCLQSGGSMEQEGRIMCEDLLLLKIKIQKAKNEWRLIAQKINEEQKDEMREKIRKLKEEVARLIRDAKAKGDGRNE